MRRRRLRVRPAARDVGRGRRAAVHVQRVRPRIDVRVLARRRPVRCRAPRRGTSRPRPARTRSRSARSIRRAKSTATPATARSWSRHRCAQPTPTPTPTPTPVVNRTVVVARGTGTVKVRSAAASATWSSTRAGHPGRVDRGHQARRVSSRRSRRRAPPPQKAEFFDGMFRVTQSHGITDLKLTEELAPCPKRGAPRRGEEAQDAQAVGQRQGRVPHDRQVQRRDGARHRVARAGLVRGDAHPRQAGVVSVRDRSRSARSSCRAGKRYVARPRRLVDARSFARGARSLSLGLVRRREGQGR